VTVAGEHIVMSDRRKMIDFISAQLPGGEDALVLAEGPSGQIVAHVAVAGDDIMIGSNCPEWVTLREVYAHLRWKAMPLWEQRQTLFGDTSRPRPIPQARLERVAERMESYLARFDESATRLPGHATGGGGPDQPAGPAIRPIAGGEAMTTNDVATFLGCSYTEARQQMLDGRIKAVKDGRWLRTRREWVEEYVAGRTVQPVPEPGRHPVPSPARRKVRSTVKTGGIGHRFLKGRAK
jgi:excisionase family DNA binding protein